MWSEWTTKQAATCTVGGTEQRTCSVCEAEETRHTDAHGHDLVPHEAKAATCTEAGWDAYNTCSRCDYTTYEEIEALGHFFGNWTRTTEPTCTSAGEETRYCSRCSETETRPVDALGHDWGPWEVITKPTNNEAGREARFCYRCFEIETRSIDPIKPAPAPAPQPDPEPAPALVPASQPATEPELPFTDVTRDMDIYDDVKYLYDKGIFELGLSETEFGPYVSLSRAMLVKLLWQLDGRPEVEFAGVFDDVPAGEWYSAALEWAASKGLVLGYGDGTFGLSDDVTREFLATVLYRFAKCKGYETDAFYAVVDGSSEWAAEAMRWAASIGLLVPDADGSYRPGEPATRAEIAKALHVFLENVAESNS